MIITNGPDDQPTGPQTPEEAAFLAAYRELDEVDRVYLWDAILMELGRRPELPEESPDLEELPP